jgi:hypothetical protein
MSINDRFRRVHHARQDDRSADALPTTLVEACGELLAVDGVGIGLTGEMRVPLAATSAEAVTAEALQTTIGEGPCLTAAAHGTRLVADATSMATTWPIFGSALISRTSFRSVASVPLRTVGGSVFGAVDLYSADADATTLDAVIDDAARIAEVIAGGLDRRFFCRCHRERRPGVTVDAVAVGESSFPGLERDRDDDGPLR